MPVQPQKILFVIDRLIRGGTELQLVGLIARLDPTQFTPYLLTIRTTDPELVPVNCTHLPWQVPTLFSANGVLNVLKLRRFLKRQKITIVQTYFPDSTLFAGLAAWLARTPVRIACFRDMAFWRGGAQSAALKAIYASMTGYLCNAEIVKQHFADTFGIAVDKAHVIHNGIAIDDYTYVRHSEHQIHIGIVGNMSRRVKRTDLFIQAAAIVAQHHPQVTWHVIGDGELKPLLQTQSVELGISDKVVFTGNIGNVADYLNKLAIGVICSDSEGLSNAIIEYMLTGATTIATQVGGNPELVDHMETGLLTTQGSAAELAKAIQYLIENPDTRLRLAQNARKKAIANYSWKFCIQRHCDYYSKLMSSSTVGGQ